MLPLWRKYGLMDHLLQSFTRQLYTSWVKDSCWILGYTFAPKSLHVFYDVTFWLTRWGLLNFHRDYPGLPTTRVLDTWNTTIDVCPGFEDCNNGLANFLPSFRVSKHYPRILNWSNRMVHVVLCHLCIKRDRSIPQFTTFHSKKFPIFYLLCFQTSFLLSGKKKTSKPFVPKIFRRPNRSVAQE